MYLIRCQPQIKLRLPFKELSYEFLDFLGGLVQWLSLCAVKTLQCRECRFDPWSRELRFHLFHGQEEKEILFQGILQPQEG